MSTEALQLLKLALNHELYEKYKGLFLDEFFARPVDKLWNVIKEAHEEYQRDITETEVLALVFAENGTLTSAMKNNLGELLEEVKQLPAIGNEVAYEVIRAAHKRELGRAIIEESYSLIENRDCNLDSIQANLEQLKNGSFTSNENDLPISTDIEELLRDIDTAGGWSFNISSLASKIPVVRPGEFMVCFALVETGKTAFWISLACAAGGWIDQGAAVHVLCNEEYARRNMIRAISCASGLTVDEMRQDVKLAKSRSTAVQERMNMRDTQDWSIEDINSYCQKHKPDILIIDQLDKVRFSGSKDAPTHEKLGWIYNQAREIAKRHNCLVVGISQASNDANGKDTLDLSMLAGSKVAKPAEADLILGIGHNSILETGDNKGAVNYRLITASKNKCSGWHGSVATRIDPLRSTYHDCEQQR